jgi:hypothetical protein
MKKIKSPWYGVLWISIWTIALVWFLISGIFNQKEMVGLVLVWAIMVGITIYLLVRDYKINKGKVRSPKKAKPGKPTLNGPCPCGSGLKYKRCCGK